MISSIETKPSHPKNGDKWRNSKGTFIFRFGGWKKISNEISKNTCSKCGTQYEYSKLLDAMRCPKCTDEKLVKEFFLPKILKMMNQNA